MLKAAGAGWVPEFAEGCTLRGDIPAAGFQDNATLPLGSDLDVQQQVCRDAQLVTEFADL